MHVLTSLVFVVGLVGLIITKSLKRLLAAGLMVGSIVATPVHAEVSVKGLKPQAAPPTYEVDGKQASVAEATIALLNGRKAFKCTEMELQESRTGIAIKAKKGN